ncbi:MAG: HEAT repeat domain-containing protein [Spirochaetales bacterium]|nr:HEAT repeat domain-containing protein [Spirochaetales bacterium]
MRKTFLFILILILILMFLTAGLFAQNNSKIVKSFKRNFAIASLDVKIQILQDAAKSKSKDMGPLYLQAVDFVLDNSSLIPTDLRFRQLSVIAANEIASVDYEKAKYSLWKLFQIDKETSVRVPILNALGITAKGDSELIESMNKWMETQNNVFKTGKVPDLQVISAAVKALGKLGDPSSFPILFTAMNLGYSDSVTKAARTSLFVIKGNLKDMLLGIVKNEPLSEKKAALIMAMNSDKLQDDDKGEIAEKALGIGLHTGTQDALKKQTAREIRYTAIRAVSERKWSKATSLAIEHLNKTIEEYERGISTKGYLLEAIACLGNMGTHEAAVRLTQYLVLLNSYTEKGKGYDIQIMLAVLNNLGKLGDKVAFDDLMYTQYLNYSDSIKKAAKKALDKIKW